MDFIAKQMLTFHREYEVYVEKREFGAYDFSRDGIKHMNIIDFC